MSWDGIAKLSNSTVWRIPPGHLPRTKDWAPGTDLVVERSNNPGWQFVIKNSATPQQWVSATPSGGYVFP